MSTEQFRLPDVGEGLTEADIVSWKVKPGDTIKVNDIIVEIETAKSLVELPSPYAGVVETLLVDEGATVPVGEPIIAVRTADAAAPADASASESSTDMVPEPPSDGEAEGERQAVLVGYGPRTTAAKRRARKTTPATPAADPTPAAPSAPSEVDLGESRPSRPTYPAEQAEESKINAGERVVVLAKPPVRKLARDLGVDITTVTPTGPSGTVTRDDIQLAASAAPAKERPVAAAAGGWAGLPREERVPVKSVRKVTAEAMVTSAFTAPHVTEFITVDVTRTMELIDRLRTSREFRDVKLTPLAVLAKAMCVAVPRTPEVNAKWITGQHGVGDEIVVQRYVNLGIAAATPRGLVVPNIKDAHTLNLRELAEAINDLAATAREGKTTPAAQAGGTISITNVGVFGVDTGTPILPPGEAAIMAFGVVREQPWVYEGEIQKRWVTTLALSFDHRLVDGEQGSRFLADVAALLEDPANALAWA